MEEGKLRETKIPVIQLELDQVSAPISNDNSTKISKREIKRRAKAELWEKTKAQRRFKEKEKRKKRRLEKVHDVTINRKKLKEATMANSSCKVTVAIDLSFENFMDAKSIGKCIKQVHHCYSINRRAENPVQFHITSLTGKCLKEIEKHQGYINWDVNFHQLAFTEVFDHNKVVYLTSESENVIEKMEDDKVYVIGGLVDHNSQKGLCHRLAIEKKLNHGRLPLDRHIDLKSRKVLTIDHVFNILVNVCNGQLWKDAFLQVIPPRKGPKEASDVEEISKQVSQNIESVPEFQDS